MAANTSRHYGSEASMSDVEIASLAAVIKKIEHACKQQPLKCRSHRIHSKKHLLLFCFAERQYIVEIFLIESWKNIFHMCFIEYLLLGTSLRKFNLII